MPAHYSEKTCFCKTCKRWFHYLGIARHRKGHLERGETCTIEYTNGEVYTHKPRDSRKEPSNA